MPALTITVFGDFTSAATYVTEVALARLALTAPISVRHRAALSMGWRGIDDGAATLATELELPLDAPDLAPSTAKAHEACRFAEAAGSGEAMRSAIYSAYWGRREDIGRIDVLQRIGAETGLDAFEVRVALDIDRFRPEVERDDELARRLNVQTLPTVFVGTGSSALILTGAQSLSTLQHAIEQSLARGPA